MLRTTTHVRGAGGLLRTVLTLRAPRGRHRATTAQKSSRCGAPPRPPKRPAPGPGVTGLTLAPTVRRWYEPLDGAANLLVRPYVAVYEGGGASRGLRVRAGAVA